jgi:hypothetical protein
MEEPDLEPGIVDVILGGGEMSVVLRWKPWP